LNPVFDSISHAAVKLKGLYSRRDLLAGALIYGAGDLIAASLAHQSTAGRAIGIMLIGALIYAMEIPHYFHWIEEKTSHLQNIQRGLAKVMLAILYFNPLWVARHMLFILLLSGRWHEISWLILQNSAHSFIMALPVVILVNLLIQVKVTLRYRFFASATFSCCMAIYYPLVTI
jgi:hypothetical protein